MFKPIYNFIILDGDCCHNIVSALSIKKLYKPININIVGFTNSREGLDHIKKHVPNNLHKTVLFLDANMHDCSGWNVLSTINSMPDAIKNNLIVYMLFSSEKQKINHSVFPFVKGYLEKPLADCFLHITEELAELQLMKKKSA